MTTDVIVEQCDREAAAALMLDQRPLWSEHIDDMLAGNNDSNAIVQAFAHHRIAERERCEANGGRESTMESEL